MKFAVINGSPKGKNSITIQSVKYLSIIHPEHEFEILNAGSGIHGLRKDFSRAKALLDSCDAVIFSYPVYTFICPAQLHEFIALMKENDIDIKGKPATQISTSKHFYDVTAHRYIEDNCADLGLNYIRGLSADMDDLTTKKGQKELEDFFDYFMFSIENKLYQPKPVFTDDFTPVVSQKVEPETKKTDKTVVVVTDAKEDDTSLLAMIEKFKATYSGKTKVINLNDVNIKGGCLGCLHCSVSGKCVYNDKFDEFLRNEIQNTEATVYAFSVKDHSMGVRFKLFDDRQFCNGHRTVTMGKSVSYLISGNLSQEENLRMIINARAEAGGNFLCGIATDEKNPDEEIEQLVKKLEWVMEKKYNTPSNFFGVGGIRIFRDLIYMMRGMMRADHKFYKKNGFYDFPQKKLPVSLAMYAVGSVFANEKVLKKAGPYITKGMVMPYQKVLDEAEKRMKK